MQVCIALIFGLLALFRLQLVLLSLNLSLFKHMYLTIKQTLKCKFV